MSSMCRCRRDVFCVTAKHGLALSASRTLLPRLHFRPPPSHHHPKLFPVSHGEPILLVIEIDLTIYRMLPAWLNMGRNDYFPIQDEDLPPKSELRLPLEPKAPPHNRWWANVMLVLQTGLIIALLVSLHILANRHPSNITCAKQLSPYCEFINEQIQVVKVLFLDSEFSTLS